MADAVPQTVTIAPKRMMGPFTADAVVEERKHHKMTITDHPVEQNAKISDHAYRNPNEVVLTYAWSLSGSQAQNDPNFLYNLFQKLLALQTERTLFTVYTSKNVYPNMLLEILDETTTKETENSLVIRAQCREIIIVTTQLITVPAAAVLKNVPANASIIPQGQQSLQPADKFNQTAAGLASL